MAKLFTNITERDLGIAAMVLAKLEANKGARRALAVLITDVDKVEGLLRDAKQVVIRAGQIKRLGEFERCSDKIRAAGTGRV